MVEIYSGRYAQVDMVEIYSGRYAQVESMVEICSGRDDLR